MTRTMHEAPEDDVLVEPEGGSGRRGRRWPALVVAVALVGVAVGAAVAMAGRDGGSSTGVQQAGTAEDGEPAAATSTTVAASAPAPAGAPAPASPSCPEASTTPPEPRFGAAVAGTPSGLLVFGGRGADNADRSDMWSFACGRWARPIAAGASAPPSFGGVAAYDAARGNTVLLASDGSTWVSTGGAWARRQPATSPARMFEPRLAYDEVRQRVVAFGRAMNSEALEVWSWDGSTWARAAVSGTMPGRSHAAVAFDSARGTLVVFGGTQSMSGPRMDDTWTWDGSVWRSVEAAHRPPAGGAYAAYDAVRRVVVLVAADGSTWTWDGADWTGVAAASAGPGVRGFTSLVWQPGLDRVVLFGGKVVKDGNAAARQPMSEEVVGDLWAWDGKAWAKAA